MSGISRNEPCPCGSGKKYKQCHLDKGDPNAPASTSWLPYALVLGAVIAGVVGTVVDSWDTGVMISGVSIVAIIAWSVFRDPPPPKGGSSNPAGLDFGR